MKKGLLIASTVCIVISFLLTLPSSKTIAKSTEIESKIKTDKMVKILEENKQLRKSFSNRINAVNRMNAVDFEGSIKLKVNFNKVNDEETRQVNGDAIITVGKEKIKFKLERALLNKYIDPLTNEKIYYLTADGELGTKVEDERPVALFLAWNESNDRQQGAVTIGTASDYAVIHFGEGEEIITKDRDIRDFEQVNFDSQEYTGE